MAKLVDRIESDEVIRLLVGKKFFFFILSFCSSLFFSFLFSRARTSHISLWLVEKHYDFVG